MAGTSYTLDGQSDEVKKHVGHRVEVTGTTSGSSSMSGGSTSGSGSATGGSGTSGSGTTASGTSGSGSGSGSMSGSMAPQHLQVTTIRMIAADCSGR
jgi:hypothetical protein